MREYEIKNAAESIKLPEDAKKRIVYKSLAYAGEKDRLERPKQKIKNLRRIAAVAIAAVMLLSVTAYAANGELGSWNTRSTGKVFRELPTASRCLSELGCVPVMVNSFENGYTFSGGMIEVKTFKDKSGGVLEEYQALSLNYEKDGDKLFLGAEQFRTELELSGDKTQVIDGVSVIYTSYINKVVPVDYELTAADIAARDSGRLVFSYGSRSPEIVHVQGVFWEMNGVRYHLIQLDGALTAEELFNMAGELIGQG